MERLLVVVEEPVCIEVQFQINTHFTFL